MYKVILTILLVFAIIAFAQTEINWWVVDNGAGMRLPAAGDTLWISIGQSAIGPSSHSTTYLGAGYLYSEDTELKILKSNEVPTEFAITSIYPNPFNSSCAIEFKISEKSDVAIELYDMQGRKIGNLLEKNNMKAGKYQMKWNAKNLPSGVYFVRLKSSDHTITRRITLIK